MSVVPEEDAGPPCVGVCMNDPESGYCLGCGRAPFSPEVAEPPPEVDEAGEEPPPA